MPNSWSEPGVNRRPNDTNNYATCSTEIDASIPSWTNKISEMLRLAGAVAGHQDLAPAFGGQLGELVPYMVEECTMSAAPILNTICRGLVGHVSYLATCSLNTVYSEYLLYEPIARIGQAKGYTVRCEVPVGSNKTGPGDLRRIDFLFTKERKQIAIEVKWLKRRKRDVSTDIEKLRMVSCSDRFLLLFGRGDVLDRPELRTRSEALETGGKLVRWEAGKTDYAARWFRIRVSPSHQPASRRFGL